MTLKPTTRINPLFWLARWGRSRHSAVLAYHGIAEISNELDPNLLLLAPSRFRAQLDLLLAAGFKFVPVEEFVRLSQPTPPPGLIALSFDDGLQDNYTNLLPILKEYDLPASVYVTTGLLGKDYPWTPPEAGIEMMTAGQVAEMAAAGVEIGAHTVTHPDMSDLDYDESLSEILESRDRLEEITGNSVHTFAYPFATEGPEARRAAMDAGFSVALGYGSDPDWPRSYFPRIALCSRDNSLTLTLRLLGVYDLLADSPPGRLLRGVVRRIRGRGGENASR